MIKLKHLWPFFYKRFFDTFRFLFSCEIPIKYFFNNDLKIPHCVGIVIGRNVSFGKKVTILSGVTIGSRSPDDKKQPTIEDDVYIGSGAKVIGDIIIGKGAKIGANAVVTKNVDSYTTVVGMPAQPLKK